MTQHLLSHWNYSWWVSVYGPVNLNYCIGKVDGNSNVCECNGSYYKDLSCIPQQSRSDEILHIALSSSSSSWHASLFQVGACSKNVVVYIENETAAYVTDPLPLSGVKFTVSTVTSELEYNSKYQMSIEGEHGRKRFKASRAFMLSKPFAQLALSPGYYSYAIFAWL